MDESQRNVDTTPRNLKMSVEFIALVSQATADIMKNPAACGLVAVTAISLIVAIVCVRRRFGSKK